MSYHIPITETYCCPIKGIYQFNKCRLTQSIFVSRQLITSIRLIVKNKIKKCFTNFVQFFLHCLWLITIMLIVLRKQMVNTLPHIY